jgi:hypothetical protein
MAEHEHEIVTHLYHVKIPYHLTGQELNIEHGSEGSSNGNFGAMMQVMIDHYKEDEAKRVITAAALLLEKYPHRTLAEALDTAMVWERG